MARRGRPPKYSQVRNELAKMLQREHRALIKRIERIEAKYGSTPARTELRERGLERISVKNLTTEQLGLLRTDIQEISQYPTASMKTVASKNALENYNKYVSRWIDLFDNDKPTYDRVMKIYNRMVNENEWTEHIKYQVMEELMDRVNVTQMTDEGLHNFIRELVENAYKANENNLVDIKGGRAYAINGKVRSRR